MATAKKRAGNGQGAVRERPDGTWEVRLSLSGPDGFSKIRRSVYGATQKEALAKARKLQAEADKGLLPTKSQASLRAFADVWLARKAKERAKNTVTNYRFELKYACEVLGDKPIQSIKPLDIRRLMDYLSERGLSIRTQRKVLERLRCLFKEALALEVVYKDPTAAIKIATPSGQDDPPGRALEPEEIRALLLAMATGKSQEMPLLIRLLLATGLRRGEALALTWADVDFSGVLNVRRSFGRAGFTTPKTKNSRRTVPIPKDALGLLAERYQELMTAGHSPLELKACFVFGHTKPLDYNAPNHYLTRLCQRAGVRHIRIHDLRHTWASLALARKVPLEVVSERLGHANATITLNRYRHVLEEERQGFVLELDELLSGLGKMQA